MEQKIPLSVIVAIILVIVAAGIIVFSVQQSPSITQPIRSGTVAPADPPAPVTTLMTIPATPRPVIPNVSEEKATSLLNEKYPAWYSIASVNLTDRYTGKNLYEFALIPSAGSPYKDNTTIYVDAATGDFYLPSQEKAGITIDQAKRYARQAFPAWTPDRIIMQFSDGSNYIRGWNFQLMKDNEILVSGTIHADTGDLLSYNSGITRMGRPGTPSITMDEARVTADNEIRKRNGEVSLKMVESRYDRFLGAAGPDSQVAGTCVFVYKRIIQSVPCDRDGFTLVIDSVTGNVTEYSKYWSLPVNAVASSFDAAISRDASETLVRKEARARYPESADSLTIVSADLRWKDEHNPDTITPAPGSIPLAWKVTFDDAAIRAQQYPNPGVGWVDAQNGTLLELNYRH